MNKEEINERLEKIEMEIEKLTQKLIDEGLKIFNEGYQKALLDLKGGKND